ncbi:MAG TPA: alpha/beta fold hydrolase [Verrucomicrobiae bacterium]
MRRRRRKILFISGLLLLLGFVALNVVAYQHAWAMTHFVRDDNRRTAPPEQLTTGSKIKVLFTGVSIPRPENKRTPQDVGLEFVSYRFMGAKGLELEAWRIPHPAAKTVVILFHGYASAKDSQLDTVKALNEMGAECWLVDFHGSGGSGGDTTSIGWDEAKDVAASFRFVKVRSEGKKIVLLGSSLGAASILRAVAAEGVEPDGVILECPFNNLLETTQNRFRVMKLPSFPLAQLLVFWGGKQLGFDGFVHNPAEYAKAVKCPALLMNGDTDARVTLENIEEVRRNLPGAATFHVFKETGHESYLRKQPAEWKRLVRPYILTQNNNASLVCH